MANPSRDLIETIHEKCRLTQADRDRAKACGGNREIALIQVCLIRKGYMSAGACDGWGNTDTATATAEYLKDNYKKLAKEVAKPDHPRNVPHGVRAHPEPLRASSPRFRFLNKL